jgi:hypothetical protein
MHVSLGHDTIEGRRHLEIRLHVGDRSHGLPRRLDILLGRGDLGLVTLDRLCGKHHIIASDDAGRLGGGFELL